MTKRNVYGSEKADGFFFIDEQLRFTFFGLECALHIEFNASETERVFIEAQIDADGSVNCSAKQYTFWGSPKLRVTGYVDDYEPEKIQLIVESKKPLEPSLSAIGERAKYQVFRMKRWQEAQEILLEELHQRIAEHEETQEEQHEQVCRQS